MTLDLEALERLAEAATPLPDTEHPLTCPCDECCKVWAHATSLAYHGRILAADVPALCREVRELRAESAAAHASWGDWESRAVRAEAECAELREALERILDKGEPMSAAIAQDAIRPMRIVESRAALARVAK